MLAYIDLHGFEINELSVLSLIEAQISDVNSECTIILDAINLQAPTQAPKIREVVTRA